LTAEPLPRSLRVLRGSRGALFVGEPILPMADAKFDSPQPDYVGNMLKTMQRFPMRSHVDQLPVQTAVTAPPSVQEVLPRMQKARKDPDSRPYFRSRLCKLMLVMAVVAVVTALLRSATLRLDALAHVSANMLAPTGTTWAVVTAGAGAGALHALSGPDHLAALAPLSLKVRGGPGAAFRSGVFWGSGHVLGQLFLGLGLLSLGHCSAICNFAASLKLGAIAERAAAAAFGVVLMLIGGLGLKEAREWDDSVEEAGAETASKSSQFCLKTLCTGVLSGMHPDALLLCLPVLALRTRLAGVAFLSAFGAGTLVAMGGYAAALHSACHAFGDRAVRRISVVSSGVAVVVGAAVCASALGIPLLGALL